MNPCLQSCGIHCRDFLLYSCMGFLAFFLYGKLTSFFISCIISLFCCNALCEKHFVAPFLLNLKLLNQLDLIHLLYLHRWWIFFQDDSRRLASTLFPSLSSLLKRKKDHGTLFDPICFIVCYHAFREVYSIYWSVNLVTSAYHLHFFYLLFSTLLFQINFNIRMAQVKRLW